MKKLDEEKPLLPEGFNAMSANSIPLSMHDHSSSHYQLTSLYPIVERPEDISSPPYGGDAQSLFNHMFPSQPGSMGPMSSDLDGIISHTGLSSSGMPSVTTNNSLGGVEDRETVYPNQTVVFDINMVSYVDCF